MLENSPSFGSTSLLPSLANLPPIRVHMEDGGGGGGGSGIGVQDQKMGIEEQFAQMTVGGGVGQSKTTMPSRSFQRYHSLSFSH
ncbi:hypothetical protein ACFX12_012193 [Malus domestica]